eukprot:397820-Rhodomonas_salina.2
MGLYQLFDYKLYKDQPRNRGVTDTKPQQQIAVDTKAKQQAHALMPAVMLRGVRYHATYVPGTMLRGVRYDATYGVGYDATRCPL